MNQIIPLIPVVVAIILGVNLVVVWYHIDDSKSFSSNEDDAPQQSSSSKKKNILRLNPSLSTTSIAPEASSSASISRRRNQERNPLDAVSGNLSSDDVGDPCANYPFWNEWLPNGMTLLNVTDGSKPLCGKAKNLLAETFFWGDERGHTLSNMSFFEVARDSAGDIDCSQIPIATIVSVLRINVANPAFNAIRRCLQDTAQLEPHILIRVPPQSQQAPDELTSKSGLAKLVQKYTSCGDNGECIVPETFMITTDLTDCQSFFFNLENNAGFRSQRWIIKPTSSSRGKGIELVTDLEQQLVNPYGSCDFIGNFDDPIVVQRYVTPFLIDGRSFHLRTYFAYKFASAPDEDDIIQDPPQAWRVDSGTLQVCAVPFSNAIIGGGDADSAVLAADAVVCNRPGRTILPYEALKTTFTDTVPNYYGVTSRLTTMFRQLAHVFNAHADATGSHAFPNEVAWTMVGVDVLIDNEMRPWIVDINPCHKSPKQFYNRDEMDGSWNPYASFMRVIMSHYQRKMLGYIWKNEESCNNLEMNARVHNVFDGRFIDN